MWESLAGAVELLAQPRLIGLALLTSVYSLFVGAIPGLTATMAMALLVPFTFFMDQATVLATVIAMSGMAIFAGDIPATLVLMPGTPSSAAYTEDSYALTQKGKAARALGIDVMGSTLGGLLGALALMLRESLSGLRQRLGVLLRSSGIGTLIGALPGAGADIGAWISYGVGRSSSRRPEEYGKGSEEAIVSGTSANNAALAGTWIPALVFGIPGDSITAILLGVMMMKGIRPGPAIFESQGDLV